MKNFSLILLLPALCLLLSCTKSHKQSGQAVRKSSVLASLPDIEISTSPDGIVDLPEDVSSVFSNVFTKYTKIRAPNGKSIHLLAQDGWTRDQIKKARNVLIFILTDFPGSAYGANKSAVANAMADRKATMVLFNTEPDLRKAMRGTLRNGTNLHMQDLRANECPAEGTEDYMKHITRDASFEEIWHLVHDNGVKIALPEMLSEMKRANDIAATKGWRAWPEDEPEEHPNEYVGVLIDNYYDLWTLKPKKYEGRDIHPEDVPEGESHFGRYFAGSRVRMEKLDPDGYSLVQKFFPPFLTYTPELPADFEGTFSLKYDETLGYTNKSQHLVNVTLTGAKKATLIGNAYDNTLQGNAGENLLVGGFGNDRLDGGAGLDTAEFTGISTEYCISIEDDAVVVEDSQPHRDGRDICQNIEILKFRDKEIRLESKLR